VPDRAASLRPIGRLGLVFACAGAVVCIAAAAESARSASQPPKSQPAASPGPGRLWSRFPLAERPNPGRPADDAGAAAPDGPSRAALAPAPPTVDRPSRLRRYLVAAFGTSIFATAFLLALLTVTASNTAAFHRLLARRGAPLPEPRPAPRSEEAVVASRGAPLPEPRPAPRSEEAVVASRHLVFVPADGGYTLVEVEGDPPGVGSWLNGSDFRLGGRFKVSKVGPSPLPADSRRCVYLERS
jgi:hypothetical protein